MSVPGATPGPAPLPPRATAPAAAGPSDALRRLVQRHEGLRLRPYRCPAGALTVGWGRNLDANGISRAEAEILLDADLARALDACARRWPWWGGLDEARRAAMVDLAFNLGPLRLAGFKRFLGAMEAQDFEAAERHLKASRWAQQVGTRAVTIRAMVKTGRYPEWLEG